MRCVCSSAAAVDARGQGTLHLDIYSCALTSAPLLILMGLVLGLQLSCIRLRLRHRRSCTLRKPSLLRTERAPLCRSVDGHLGLPDKGDPAAAVACLGCRHLWKRSAAHPLPPSYSALFTMRLHEEQVLLVLPSLTRTA